MTDAQADVLLLSAQATPPAAAVPLYRAILAGNPAYPRADAVLWRLAEALVATGQPDAANTERTLLVKTRPDSAHACDAWVAMGEYWFDKSNAYKALVAYQHAAACTEHPLWAFASYKLAWCYYNVGEFDKAIAILQDVYIRIAATPTGMNARLAPEVLQDLTRFYADAGAIDDAEAWFTAQAQPGMFRRTLVRAAEIDDDQGRFEAAIAVWRRLIAAEPASAEAARFQHAIVQDEVRMGRWKEALVEVTQLVQAYGPTPTAEEDLRTLATTIHQAGVQLRTGTRAFQLYLLADRAYLLYFEAFPTSPHVYDLRAAYADVLYAEREYERAYAAYLEVVALDPDGAQARRCAAGAIDAARDITNREMLEGNAGRVLTAWQEKELAAIDAFVAAYPDDPHRARLLYTAGYLLYNVDRVDEAGTRFRAAIHAEPESKDAEQAAWLLLEQLEVDGRWIDIQATAQALLDEPRLGDAAFRKELGALLEKARRGGR